MGDLKFLQSFASWHPSVALATGAAFLALYRLPPVLNAAPRLPVKFPPVMVWGSVYGFSKTDRADTCLPTIACSRLVLSDCRQ